MYDTSKSSKLLLLVALVIKTIRTIEQCSHRQNVLLSAFPRYRGQKAISRMALRESQQSKVIKPQRPFCVVASSRPKTVQKRRRKHGYRIDVKSVFALAWARKPPRTGLPYMFEASLQRLCRAILPAEGQIKKARKCPMQN